MKAMDLLEMVRMTAAEMIKDNTERGETTSLDAILENVFGDYGEVPEGREKEGFRSLVREHLLGADLYVSARGKGTVPGYYLKGADLKANAAQYQATTLIHSDEFVDKVQRYASFLDPRAHNRVSLEAFMNGCFNQSTSNGRMKPSWTEPMMHRAKELFASGKIEGWQLENGDTSTPVLRRATQRTNQAAVAA